MTPVDAVKSGWYSVKVVDDLNWLLEHFSSNEEATVQMVPGAAFIVQTADGRFHWSGHDLSKGLREADEYLAQHSRKR